MTLKSSSGVADKYKLGLPNTGLMNDVVYCVHGGYEDWAYGGSWDSNAKDSQWLGDSIYNKSRCEYSDSALRTAVYLVESSDIKDPKDSYGERKDSSGKFQWNNQGHISKNMLVADKLVQVTRQNIEVLGLVETKEDLTLTYRISGCFRASLKIVA